MKLTDFLAAEDLTIKAFAVRAGLTAEGIRLILSGQRQPRRKTAEKIRKATKGKVTIMDLLSEAA